MSISTNELLETSDAGSRASALRFPPPALRLLLVYWQASRPRIVGMVLFTMTIAALVAGEQTPSWPVLANALTGAALVIVGAIALNQRLEHASDAKMPRTSNRPLPAGRLTDRQMTIFGVVTTAAGLAYLAVSVNAATVLLAAASWVIYVWIYTPSKRLTPWQTALGAVAGAMPTLLGAAAVDAALSPEALTLFGIVYFWQFPHAMAIAWLYRDQFASADVKLPTVLDPTGRRAAWLSLVGALALVPVSLVPVQSGTAGWGYAVVALILAATYLLPAIRFLFRTNDSSARKLLHASFLYLPAAFMALLIALLW